MSVLTWNDLFLKGSLVDLDLSIWSARALIKAEDLGIQKTEAVIKAISLGHHKLIQRKALKEITRIGSVARAVVDAASLSFSVIHGTRFVPELRLETLIETLKRLRNEFDDAVARFVESYDEKIEETLPIIRTAMEDVNWDHPTAERAMLRIREAYPSREQVAGKFKLRWSVYAITSAKKSAYSDDSDIRNAIRDMVSGLREEVSAKLAELLEFVSKGGKLSKRSIDSAIKTLDRAEEINVLGDEVLDRQIGLIRSILSDETSVLVMKRLEEIKASLGSGMEEAVSKAELSITELGRRRFTAEREVM
jgi:hypothetical protein